MTQSLLSIAAQLDQFDVNSARQSLMQNDLSALPTGGRLVLLGLWQRVLMKPDPLTEAELNRDTKLRQFFAALRPALNDPEGVWPVYNQLDELSDEIGADALSALLCGCLWDQLPHMPHGFQYEVITRAFLGGIDGLFERVFVHVICQDAGFVPDFWQSQSLFRVWSERGVEAAASELEAMLSGAGRQDLLPLMKVYLGFTRQDDFEDTARAARDLSDPTHRAQLASYLLGVSQTVEHMGHAVALHDDLAASDQTAERQFMQARLAVAKEEWTQVLSLTEGLTNHPDLAGEAVCLRALAFARTGAHEAARGAIDFVRLQTGGKWFLKARADLIDVALRTLQDGGDLPNDVPAPRLAVRHGRPLAQSLWIGPRLRWIEDLSIRSYLQNGWRYQLYCYEPPQNVPEGVEVMDAAAILPRSAIFVEGANSGMHKGSVGAFSDLFRYALLLRRGGMWTDTDAINLVPFDPDGARFISTEWSDAGLIGLNGAMMAAPAHDPLQAMAYDRSKQVLESEDLHFAAIGPKLLAELVAAHGPQGYRLMPTDFLNPIGWMETGLLLRAPDVVAKRLKRSPNLTNVHVYTETWRLIGLSLATPPERETFLGRLYDRLRNIGPRDGRGVLKLME